MHHSSSEIQSSFGITLPPVFLQCSLLPAHYILVRESSNKYIFRSIDGLLQDDQSPYEWSKSFHPWSSEILFLEYRRGEKPQPIMRKDTRNGLRVLIAARHGDAGLYADNCSNIKDLCNSIISTNPKSNVNQPSPAPQFLGFKDTGVPFSLPYPTSKTLYTMTNVDSRGFALRTEVGTYLCVLPCSNDSTLSFMKKESTLNHSNYTDGGILATTPKYAPAECTFRFVFVPKPKDPVTIPSSKPLGSYVPNTNDHLEETKRPFFHPFDKTSQRLDRTLRPSSNMAESAIIPGTPFSRAPLNSTISANRGNSLAKFAYMSTQRSYPRNMPQSSNRRSNFSNFSHSYRSPPQSNANSPMNVPTLNYAVAITDAKGRFLVRIPTGQGDGNGGSNEVLRLATLYQTPKQYDNRILYFDMGVLPEETLSLASDIIADHTTSSKIDTRPLPRALLERASPLDLSSGDSGKCVVLRSAADGRYLAAHPQTGSLLLTSCAAVDTVWIYRALPHSPLALALESVVAGGFLSVHSKPSKMLDCSRTTREPSLSSRIKNTIRTARAKFQSDCDTSVGADLKSNSAALTHLIDHAPSLIADSKSIGARESLALSLPPSLAQAVAMQTNGTPSKYTSYFASAITGASFLGATAGVVNMVINANKVAPPSRHDALTQEVRFQELNEHSVNLNGDFWQHGSAHAHGNPTMPPISDNHANMDYNQETLFTLPSADAVDQTSWPFVPFEQLDPYNMLDSVPHNVMGPDMFPVDLAAACQAT